jgi:hypothetical protein
LELRYDENAMYMASMDNKIETLNWWLTSGIPDLKYNPKKIKSYSPEVKSWWNNSGLPLKYVTISTKNARKN